MDVAVGIIDVKSYYIETPEDVADRVRRCLQFAPAGKLAFAPDCGLSQTARWAARQKLINMVAGVRKVGVDLLADIRESNVRMAASASGGSARVAFCCSGGASTCCSIPTSRTR